MLLEIQWPRLNQQSLYHTRLIPIIGESSGRKRNAMCPVVVFMVDGDIVGIFDYTFSGSLAKNSLHLLDQQINSATTAEDIYKVGIYDNTSIEINSTNPQADFERIAKDMQEKETFLGYKPLSPEEYRSKEEDRRVAFAANSQFVQLKLSKNLLGEGRYYLSFITSNSWSPAGFEGKKLNPGTIDEDRERHWQATRLATSKEQAIVVKDFLRYCEKREIRGALNFYFRASQAPSRRADLTF